MKKIISIFTLIIDLIALIYVLNHYPVISWFMSALIWIVEVISSLVSK